MNDRWPQVPLGQVTRQVRHRVEVVEGVEYPLLGMRMYAQGPYPRETVTRESSKAAHFFAVSPGQFVYNRMFAWGGSFGVVTQELAGSFVSNEFPLFECDASRLDVRYLGLWFQQPAVWDAIEAQSTGTTKSRTRWKEQSFQAYSIPLPPLVVQRRIVDLMEHLDTHLANLETERGGLLASKKGLWTSLDNGRTEFETVAWSKARLGDVALVVRDRIDPAQAEPDDEWIHYSIPSLDESGRPVTESPSSIKSQKFRVLTRSVLISMLNPRIPRAWIAEGGTDVVCSTEFAVTVPRDDSLLLDYLFQYTRSDTFWEQLQERAVGTTGSRQRVKPAAMLELPMNLPPLAEQRRIADLMTGMDDLVKALDYEIHKLHGLRSSVLNAMLTGASHIPAAYDALLAVS